MGTSDQANTNAESITPEEAAARSFYSKTNYEKQNQPATPSAPPLTADGKAQERAEAQAAKVFPSMCEKPAEQGCSESTPAHIRELRETDAARKMFSPQSMLKAEIPDDLFTNLAGEGITDELKAAAVREWREIATDVGITGNDLREGIDVFKQVASLPADDQRSEEWQAQSRKWLNEQYGSQAPQMLALAQKLVSRDPRVQNLIRANGRFGDHPKIVQVLVHAAIRERGAGRL